MELLVCALELEWALQLLFKHNDDDDDDDDDIKSSVKIIQNNFLKYL